MVDEEAREMFRTLENEVARLRIRVKELCRMQSRTDVRIAILAASCDNEDEVYGLSPSH